jgi:hypothetical protein
VSSAGKDLLHDPFQVPRTVDDVNDIGGLSSFAKDNCVGISEVEEQIAFRQVSAPVPKRSTFDQITEGREESSLNLVCRF